MQKELKDFIKGLSVLLLYLLSSFITALFVSLLHININNFTKMQKIIYNLSNELILVFIIILIYRKKIINDFKNFKNCHFINYIRYWLIAITLMLISNIIINMITGIDTSTNQEIIVNTLKKAPIYTAVLTIIIAPILEELVFRLSFKKMFKTNIIFIITSGLFFGFMHVSDPKSLIELIYIIPYSIPGFIFAYTLTKSNNIMVPIGLHFIHNTSMFILQLILILL